MTHDTSAPGGWTTTPTAQPPASPYDTPPTWTPTAPGTAASAPVAPEPAARPPFRRRLAVLRERTVALWVALAVGAACLVVGLGFGVLVGHATADSGTGGVVQQPGVGGNQVPGQGFGHHGFGGQGADGQGTDGQDLGQSSGTLS